jgi:CTP:molybdopterin cytidylyltransferase MocA
VIAGLVLAAGEGRRFGAAKQLAPLDGRPLLDHAVSAMRAAPVDELVVVLGARAQEIRAAADLGGTRVVVAEDWADGQSASLRAGLDAVPDADAVVVALGDQPFLSPRAVEAVLAARGAGAEAVRATYDGVPGHPIVLERPLFAAVRRLRGDEGARSLLAGARAVACDGLGRADDVDTPEDLRRVSPPA